MLINIILNKKITFFQACNNGFFIHEYVHKLCWFDLGLSTANTILIRFTINFSEKLNE